MAIICAILTGLFIGTLRAETPTDTRCHVLSGAHCDVLRSEEALRCRVKADVQCDLDDAEFFIAHGDVYNAESRIDQSCEKYERLLGTMLPDVELEVISASTIQYVRTSSSIFALLARDGDVEDLSRAVVRLEKSREFLISLLERREDLQKARDVQAALSELTARLASALDQLARRELKRADERFSAVGRTGHGDGGAMSYYRRAAAHSAQAFHITRNLSYKGTEIEAKLAQTELNVVLAGEDRVAATLVCEGYRAVQDELLELHQLLSDDQRPKFKVLMAAFEARAGRGSRACLAGPRISAGATLFGVGAASLGVAIGLYAQYARSCEFGINPVNGRKQCLGIPSDGGETDRYTGQVRASMGLAVIGGVLLAAGTSLMVPALVQRKRARSQRFSVVPSMELRRVGILIQLNF